MKAHGQSPSRINTEEREFLTLTARTVFANPFSDDHADFYLKLSGQPRGTSVEDQTVALLERLRKFLRELDRRHVRLGNLSKPDRRLLRYAHLYSIFHEHVAAFDQLILAQLEAGDCPCRVAFAGETMGQLRGIGLDEAEACRDFAMFYQLRRAYYFIDRALVGRSPSMKRLRRSLWNNVFTQDMRLYEDVLWNRLEDFSTLLLGDTGTGKGAAARAIGQSGFIPFNPAKGCFTESFTRSFVDINLSQFPESLIESELFGHRQGAFTGAVESHDGILSRCSPHGAIFLDEIGDVSIPVQIKLLRVLQERTFSAVGSHERRRFAGRVIAASNKSIDDLRRRGLFRDDFFYRLCSDIIGVPPLRDRLREDPHELHELLAAMVRRIVGQPSPDLAAMAAEVVDRELGEDYGWPGNVRELEQCVRRILLTGHYGGDRQVTGDEARARLVAGIDGGTLGAQELLSAYCGMLYRRHGTYEEVARRTGLDRRTVKKHLG